ncbi:MAG: hypothetical protein ACI88H_001302 [Cocleimonas sp.]|jgi:hypothetical protein
MKEEKEMGVRDKNTADTRKELFAALERLKENEPTVPALVIMKGKGKLKVNRASVEREAGAGSGALRHHNIVVQAINNYLQEKEVDKAGLDNAEELLKKQIRDNRGSVSHERNLKEEYYEKNSELREEIKAQASNYLTHINLLLNKVPYEERERAVVELNRKNNGNVTSIK